MSKNTVKNLSLTVLIMLAISLLTIAFFMSCGGGGGGGSEPTTARPVAQVAAVSLSTGSIGTVMAHKNGEMIFTRVDRDASGNATKIIGALYMNTVNGDSAVVYLGDDGMPTKTVMGDYILLFSNWSTDGKKVDIAKIYTPSGYIEVFKGVSVNADLTDNHSVSVETQSASNRNSITIEKVTCWPWCDTVTKNLAEYFKIVGFGVNAGICVGLTATGFGLVEGIACGSALVTLATQAVGNETWNENLEGMGTILTYPEATKCITGDRVACLGPLIELISRLFAIGDDILNNNKGYSATANQSLSKPSQPSGVIQQGGGLPSCTGRYQCTPGGAMQYEPCLEGGVRECMSNCRWSPCPKTTSTTTTVKPTTSTTTTVNLVTSTTITVNPISTTTVAPSTLPQPGTYAGTCTAQGTPITCCTGGRCTTVPAPSPVQAPFNFTLAPGTPLSQFTSDVCASASASLSASGCTAPSCNYTAAASNSVTFTLSCAVPLPDCTPYVVTEICNATKQ